MVALWLSAGGAEQRHLPGKGGAGDQAALMVDAFKVMSSGYAAWMRDEKKT